MGFARERGGGGVRLRGRGREGGGRKEGGRKERERERERKKEISKMVSSTDGHLQHNQRVFACVCACMRAGVYVCV